MSRRRFWITWKITENKENEMSEEIPVPTLGQKVFPWHLFQTYHKVKTIKKDEKNL